MHGGEYREWVRPRRGGLSDHAAHHLPGRARRARRDQGLGAGDGLGAGRAGPCGGRRCRTRCSAPSTRSREEIDGRLDRLARAGARRRSTSATSTSTGAASTRSAARDEVTDPPLRTEVIDDWTRATDRVRNPEQTRLVWYAEVGADTTTIWANFQGADPNARAGRDQRAPLGVLPHRAPRRLHHRTRLRAGAGGLPVDPAHRRPARAHRPQLGQGLDHRGQRHPRREVLGRSRIGKEASTGRQLRDHARRQARLPVPARVSVLRPGRSAGTREHIGSHVIRRNTIFDCGQNGIVGHLGCVFSTIEDNHIYNIALKREFYGYEIGGIKLHAAIDVEIRHNRIHDCSLGTWLDWQTQGTRVSRNLYYAQQPGPVRRGQPRPVPGRPQRLRLTGLA